MTTPSTRQAGSPASSLLGSTDVADIGSDTRAVRRHWRVVLVCTVLGLIAGVAWVLPQPPTYSASATVLLSPMSAYLDLDPSDGPPPAITIDTDVALARSDAVIGRLAQETGLTPREARRSLSLAAPPLSTVMRLTVRADDPQTAQAGAQVTAQALLTTRRDALNATPRRYAEVFREETERVRQQLATTDVDPATTQTINEQLDRLETALGRLERQNDSPGRIIAAATVPKQADPTNNEVGIAGATMVGLLVGVGLAALKERRRRTANRRVSEVPGYVATELVHPFTGVEPGSVPPDALRRSWLLHDTVAHRRRLVAACALVGLALGVGGSALLPRHYLASTSFTVSELPGNAYSPDDRRDTLVRLENEAQNLLSDAVLTNAVTLSGVDIDPALLRTRTRVDIPARTTILKVTVRGGTPANAQALADSIAAADLAARQQRAEDSLALRRTGLQEQVTATEAALTRAIEGTKTGTEAQRAYNNQLAVSLSVRALDLRTELARVQRTSTEPGTVLAPAVEPQRASGPPMLVLAGVGLLAGLLLGATLAVVREWQQDRVRRSKDVTEAGLRVLAESDRRTDRTGLAGIDDVAHRLAAALLRVQQRPLRIGVWAMARPDAVAMADALVAAVGAMGLRAERALAWSSDVRTDVDPVAPADLTVVVGTDATGAAAAEAGASALLVVRLGRTRHLRLHTEITACQEVGTPIVGAAVLGTHVPRLAGRRGAHRLRGDVESPASTPVDVRA